MIEFAIAIIIDRRYAEKTVAPADGPLFKDKENSKEHTRLQTSEVSENAGISMIKTKACSVTEKLDLTALVAFTVSYFIFNCIYFGHYI